MKRDLPSWGIVTTLKEESRVVKRFVAHHLAIGADQIILFFDDPDDPAADLLEHLEPVTVIRCGSDHWGGRRPAAHQKRQKINANLAYLDAKVDWLIHIDADELIHNRADVAAELAAVPSTQNVVRLPVAESFAGTQQDYSIFRLALPDTPRGRRIGAQVYGEAYPVLEGGLLSHTAGKFFVRTGVPDIKLSIHGPFHADRRDNGEDSQSMTLLHLHGYDEDEWVGAVQRRLARGSYQKKFHDDRGKSATTADGLGRYAYLRRIIENEGEAGLRKFHRRVCRFGKEKRPLRRVGALIKVNLWEVQKVAHYFAEAHEVATRSFRFDPQSAQFRAEVSFRGARMIIYPDSNYVDNRLAHGIEAEKEELDAVQELVTGKCVVFYDIGANSGIYSLLVACNAASDSVVHAFEPNPAVMQRFEENMQMNGLSQVQMHQVALADHDGIGRLFLNANLGQSSLIGDENPKAAGGGSDPAAITVPLKPLAPFVEKRRDGSLTFFKIDIEGAEPIALRPFFETTQEDRWPDYVLYEHAHTDKWQVEPDDLFPQGVYDTVRRFRHNTLLCRNASG